jgi:Carboxypeptidase regulatory-like domain
MAILNRVGPLVIMLSLLAACGGGRELTQPTPVSPPVQGTVRDYQTQVPIANAEIFVINRTRSDASYRTVTDGNGHFSLPEPARPTIPYSLTVNAVDVGTGYFTGSGYRGDLFVDSGTCIARYGQVLDAKTMRPIAAASMTGVGLTTTDSDGWYRIDLGCPASGVIGFTTVALTASCAGYTSLQLIVGRGISHVSRLDFLLTPAQ